jgi:hypothetical protein
VNNLGKKKRKKLEKNYAKDLHKLDLDMKDTYKSIMKDIKIINEEFYADDMKAKKRAKKKAKGDKRKEKYYYYNDPERKLKRLQKVSELEGSDLFDRILYNMDGTSSMVKIIARLVAALILSILSIEGMKYTLSDSSLRKMTKIYELSMKM